MTSTSLIEVRHVRSIFVSDVHLGCRYADAQAFADFLNRHEADYVYLVGDIIDGWRLRKRWHWQPVYNSILSRLIKMSDNGTRVCYAPGNHDAFLRPFIENFSLGFVEIADEFIHDTADNRRYLVTHGDLFDDVEIRARWLSMLGAFGYDVLVSLNGWLNVFRRLLRMKERCYTKTIKSKVKLAVNFVSRFERRLIGHAESNDCQGVICGHVHTPAITELNNITYFNTGDWVENCTALLEYHDGQMEIVNPIASVQRYRPHPLEEEIPADEPEEARELVAVY